MSTASLMPTTESKTALQANMQKSRYRTEISKIQSEYPYCVAVGKKSPYNGRIIRTQNDYDLYCHCYALFRMYEKDMSAAGKELSAEQKKNSDLFRMYQKSMAEADRRLLAASVDLASERRKNSELFCAVRKRFFFMRAAIFALCAALAFFIFVHPFSSPREAPAPAPPASSVSSSRGTGSDRPDGYISDEYIGNKNSHKFHRSSCSYLPDSGNQVIFESRSDAISAGYSPCGRCHP